MSFLGLDIGSILQSEGPTIKCVLLSSSQRPSTEDEEDDDLNLKISASHDYAVHLKTKDTDTPQASSLNHWIYEMDVDTTPRNSMVQTLLGGPITFLGQYEEEGIVVIARKSPDSEDEDTRLPLNPHSLQPPLHKLQVYGDILLMRVAPVVEEDEEEEDEEEEEEEEATEETAKLSHETEAKLMSSDEAEQDMNDDDEPEFFLDYTKEEYIRFASRTDIVYDSNEEEEVDEEEVDEDAEHDNETDEEYEVGQEIEDGESDEDDLEEDGQMGLMNLIFSQLLRKFREKNGRGPDSEELLAMRAQLAEKLGIELEGADESLYALEAVAEEEQGDEELNENVKTTRKRPLPKEDANDCSSPGDQKVRAKKRVNFKDE